MEHVPCIFCDLAPSTLLHEFKKPPGENSRIVQCDSCGHVYVSPRKMQQYEQLPLEAYEVAKPSYEGFKYLFNMMKSMLPKTEITSILEVGTATGIFLEVARDNGHTVSGVEIWEACLRKAKSKYLDVSNCWPATRRFSAVVAIEVLEHLDNPLKHLELWAHTLLPGGTLFLTTPNWNSKARTALGWEWKVISPYGHIHYFTEETLRIAMKMVGFREVTIKAVGEYGDAQLIAKGCL